MAEAANIGSALATVAELWRYPVKSMRGESVASLEIACDGVAGDRRFAIESSGAPRGKPLVTGRERAAMLLYAAHTVDGDVRVRSPDGLDFSLEDSALLREMADRFGDGHVLRLIHSAPPLTDCRPLALLSHEAVSRLSAEFGGAVDRRRFRANVVLSFAAPTAGETATASGAEEIVSETNLSFPEDALVGRRIFLGGAELRVTERDPRCRIVILDPETGSAAPELMKLIDRRHGGRVGVYAVTVRPGVVRVGDVVRLAREGG